MPCVKCKHHLNTLCYNYTCMFIGLIMYGGGEKGEGDGVTGMKVNVICEAVEVILRVQ